MITVEDVRLRVNEEFGILVPKKKFELIWYAIFREMSKAFKHNLKKEGTYYKIFIPELGEFEPKKSLLKPSYSLSMYTSDQIELLRYTNKRVRVVEESCETITYKYYLNNLTLKRRPIHKFLMKALFLNKVSIRKALQYEVNISYKFLYNLQVATIDSYSHEIAFKGTFQELVESKGFKYDIVARAVLLNLKKQTSYKTSHSYAKVADFHPILCIANWKSKLSHIQKTHYLRQPIATEFGTFQRLRDFKNYLYARFGSMSLRGHTYTIL